MAERAPAADALSSGMRLRLVLAFAAFLIAAPAHAQSPAPERSWAANETPEGIFGNGAATLAGRRGFDAAYTARIVDLDTHRHRAMVAYGTGGTGLAFAIDRTRGVGVRDSVVRVHYAQRTGPLDISFAHAFLFGANRDTAFLVDLAARMRLGGHLAVALGADDLFGRTGAANRDPRLFGALAFRPLGDPRLIVESGIAGQVDGDVGLRLHASSAIPRVGELYATLNVGDIADERDIAGEFGVALAFGGARAAYAYEEATGAHIATVSLSSAGAPAPLPSPDYVLDVPVRSSLGARGLLALVSLLDRARTRPDLRGVFLRLRSGRMGSAYAQEIRGAIRRLRAAGKRVVCHLEQPSATELYACAAADRILMEPAGYTRLVGPSMDVMSYGRLAERLGVRADFIRIGRFKSAATTYSRERLSAPERGQREVFLDDVMARWTQDWEADRDFEEGGLRGLIDAGPHTAEEAVSGHLVDTLVDEYDAGEALEEAFEGDPRLRTGLGGPARPTWGRERGIGVLIVDGTMTDGASRDVPFVGIHTAGGRTLVRAIDGLARDPRVAAIVLRVDSPGGSALASDQVWRAIRRARERKPVIASLGRVAASGGYYVASAADAIWADPSTLTGSIGIFFGKVDVSGLAESLGVTVEQLGRGDHAGAMSMYRPFTDEERARLEELVDAGYQRFLSRVAEGREMTVEQVDALGRGRIYTGDRARAVGLVDHLGGFIQALADARVRAGLAEDAPVRWVPSRPSGVLDYLRQAGSRGAARGVLSAGPDAWAAQLALDAGAISPVAARLGRLAAPMLLSGDASMWALYRGE